MKTHIRQAIDIARSEVDPSHLVFITAAARVLAERVEELENSQPDEEEEPLSGYPMRSSGGVWMAEPGKSVARAIAEDVMDGLKMDPNDFRTRDRIINSVIKTTERMLRNVETRDYRKGTQHDR